MDRDFKEIVDQRAEIGSDLSFQIINNISLPNEED